MVHLAASSQNLSEELDKIQKENEMETSSSKLKVANTTNQQLKKAITTLTIKSKAEYQTNFRSIISQNLKVKTAFGNYSNIASTLTRLTINNCELTRVSSSIFELYQLTHLDLSANKLSTFDNFVLKRLEELNLSQNEIKTIGKNIQLPKLISLDLSFNKLNVIDRHFCANFKTLARIRLNNNEIRCFSAKFGYSLCSLQMLNASYNKLVNIPFSLSHLRLEMLELNDNPFDTSLPNSFNLNSALKTFPRLVELCARQIINKKFFFNYLFFFLRNPV
jgi:Leucine-rich repeat (LRR) protein